MKIIKETPRFIYYEENGIKKIRIKNKEVGHVINTTRYAFSSQDQSIQRNRISTIRKTIHSLKSNLRAGQGNDAADGGLFGTAD